MFGDFLHNIKDANPMTSFNQMVKCRADAIREAVRGTDHSKKWEQSAQNLFDTTDDVITYTDEYGPAPSPV